jgi:hypothetical protein
MNQEEKNETPLANGDGTRKKKLDKQHKMNGKQKQQAQSIGSQKLREVIICVKCLRSKRAWEEEN